ncbi:MAG: hypothetical protein K6D56_03175, partial [Clostridia bacterium]|nr:hypothetical protein [Clostridia bacterium]
MKNFKKVLVLLVAVAMIFSMVPSTSFAWADTENAVDTGDDSSSVFDVSEENETEEETAAVKDTTGAEEPEVAVEPEIVVEPEEPQVPDEQTSGVAADANEGGDKAVPGTDESSVSAETTGVNTTPT